MDFEWAADKNELNLAKHGLDFEDAAQILLAPHTQKRSNRGSEQRWLATGELEGRLVTVVYTLREGRYRIISARRARKNEREEYRKEVG